MRMLSILPGQGWINSASLLVSLVDILLLVKDETNQVFDLQPYLNFVVLLRFLY